MYPPKKESKQRNNNKKKQEVSVIFSIIKYFSSEYARVKLESWNHAERVLKIIFNQF